ncbi:hypothetical protein ABXN37_18860 [Piscinibacter sakaiensis]|uniref:Uncharacterized protein n=1 Tax=Piscinibacter sakaiensis TaxID=1547922 RepID=A0A0K8P4W4_PISS1|nr:hypothetical protein [Piscinibacter sakaiensis]GAP37190.1 hypothetical protein ISF6_3045 [Piscinibacter sakaiensis]
MEMTPRRRERIEAHLADSRRAMTELAFEMNDLVRFAIAASRERTGRLYHPMDPVHEATRQWDELHRRVGRLARRVEGLQARLGVPPFDAEGPVADDPDAAAG